MNINITIDGQVTATVDEPSVAKESVKSVKEANFFVPDFSSGAKLNFGKEE